MDQRESVDPEFDDDVSFVHYCAHPHLIADTCVQQGYNSVYSTDSAEESERERGRKNELGKCAKRRFEAMLRALSGRRGELARCMAFSLEHAEAATEVCPCFQQCPSAF